MKAALCICLVFVVASLSAAAQTDTSTGKFSPEKVYRMGHSTHGEVFDSGPREKPWEMEGIGKTHFPITSKHPDVQKWFDQGHTLLHSFWYYEAERAFRWCLKLDPDCAMAFWGLARAVDDNERSRTLIQEAIRRKDKVSEKEKHYIEAWAERWKETPSNPVSTGESEDTRQKQFKAALERICLRYPDDIEARSLLALENMGNNRLGTELLLQQVLAKDPAHPGAHHYRIHNWDGREGAVAVDSCAQYGRIAAGIGHAQHMPGHVYSGIGMWNEAAISMDAATRVEADYMRRRMAFPFNTWNYAHNRNYLSYIQEQLGMAEAAITGARSLLAAPLDPEYDNADKYGTHWQGMLALMRSLIKFERWKEILDPKTFSWRDIVRDKMYSAYCETVAHLGLGDVQKALKRYSDHAALKSEFEKPDNKWLEKTFAVQSLEMQGQLALSEGDTLRGLSLLADAAGREFTLQEGANDPPSYPRVLYTELGRAYLQHRSPALAIEAFEKTLTLTRNDAFALAGLVEAYSAIGEREKARDRLGPLLYIGSAADPGLKWFERARNLGIEAEPRDTSPSPQRSYRNTPLGQLGPALWAPYDAPKLEALDVLGKRVTLEEFRGKNVLLIFYLGSECTHCMEQLIEVGKRYGDFGAAEVEVLAISGKSPAQNAAALKTAKLPFRVLSDNNFENARRFKSYDDFESMELHSTILVDRRGKVHWAHNGGDPFTNFDFLLKEVKRLNALTGKAEEK